MRKMIETTKNQINVIKKLHRSAKIILKTNELFATYKSMILANSKNHFMNLVNLYKDVILTSEFNVNTLVSYVRV